MPAIRPWLYPALIPLAAVAALAALAVGPSGLPFARVVEALAGGGDTVERAVVWELRLPRALLCLIVGAMLGAAGAALQGYLRNPLADPSVLGASNAAALGAVLALYFGFADLHIAVLPAMAVAGAIAALLPLFLLARRAESPLTLILAGLAVGALAGAGISLALNLSPNPFASAEIVIWLLGSLEDRSFAHVAMAAPCVAIGLALLATQARALDALSLGEDAAAAMGVDLGRTRVVLLAGVALGVGGAVAVAGPIGFVGLIAPHLVRPFTDASPSAVLWPSAFAGAVLVTAADTAVRLIPTANELKLSVVTAFLGVPVFLYHLMRARRLW